MAGRRVAPGRAGGGEDIQTPRPRLARLATATGAIVVAAAIAISPLARSSHVWLLAGLGGAALFSLGLGLVVRWSAALAFGIALLGTEQAVRLATGPNHVDPWTPVYAAGFLLAAELAWWSIEPRVQAWAQYEATLSRLGAVAGACVGGGVLAALVVLAAGAPLRGGLALELVGVVAATAALAVVAVVARSHVR
ncbi:MAG TPA: hypothetical protein VE753_04655 [Gaiellaceae bacterium]|nr:hypothetical protein [Gaiellaceae bacterium]